MPLCSAAKTTAFFGSDARLVISASDGHTNKSTTLKELVESSGISDIDVIDAGLNFPTISPCSPTTPKHKYLV